MFLIMRYLPKNKINVYEYLITFKKYILHKQFDVFCTFCYKTIIVIYKLRNYFRGVWRHSSLEFVSITRSQCPQDFVFNCAYVVAIVGLCSICTGQMQEMFCLSAKIVLLLFQINMY